MRYRKPMTKITQEHSSSRKLIDFPCSYAWRAYYAETMDGIILPSIELPEPALPDEREAQVPLSKQPEPGWSRGQWDKVQQIQGQLLHLENKVTELLARRKPRGQY